MSSLNLLSDALPLNITPFPLPSSKTIGLVIVDEENGFCTVGCGNLAPTSPNQQISRMVEETNKVAKEFQQRGWPILASLDTHYVDKPEPPYPPHCIQGSGEDELVPDLKWLEGYENAFLMRKDCINGFIGGIQADGSNLVADWVKNNNVEIMLVVGICTDICVLDFVLTILSARNHGIVPPLQEVVVYSEGCSTFDLPKEVAKNIGVQAHPQDLTHHIGLYLAKSRGAHVIDEVIFPSE